MEMKWTIRIEPGFLWVECEGDLDLDGAKQMAEEAIAVAAQQDRDKIFFDWRKVAGEPTFMDRFEMGVAVANAYRSQNPIRYIRMALVGNEPLISQDRIGGTVAQNRGVPGLVTTDLSEALSFLGITLPVNGSVAPNAC